MRAVLWVVLLLVSVPAFWTGEKLLQNYFLERLQADLLAEIKDQSLFARRFTFLEPLRFTDYTVWGRYEAGTNQWSSLDDNELKEAIEGRFWHPTLPKRPHTVYLMTVQSKNGRPFKTWYRANLKICGDRPCPYEAQEFQEVPAPPDFMMPENARFEGRNEARQFLWFSFRIAYHLRMNGYREVNSLSVEIEDSATNPVDRFLRGAWPNQPFTRDWILVRRIYVSYAEGICEEQHGDPISLGDVCF